MSRHTHLFGASHLYPLQVYTSLLLNTTFWCRNTGFEHMASSAGLPASSGAVFAFVPVADEAAAIDCASRLLDAAIAYVRFGSIWPCDHDVAVSAAAAVWQLRQQRGGASGRRRAGLCPCSGPRYPRYPGAAWSGSSI